MSDAADRAAPIVAGHLLKIIALIESEPDPAVVMTTLSGAVVYALDKFGLTDSQFTATLARMRRGRAKAIRAHQKRGRS